MARKFLGSLWYAVMAGGLAIAMLPIQLAGQRSLAATTMSASVTEQNVPSASISSNSFSTTEPNTLVVALMGTDGPTSGGQRFTSVEGGGLEWHPAVFSNGELGDAEIWYALAPMAVVDMVVTATRASGGYTGFLDIETVAGIDPAHPVGSVGSKSGPSGGPNASVTLAQQGSTVLAVGNDWDTATLPSVAPGQTLLHQFPATYSGDSFWSQSLQTTEAAGTAVTVSDTVPTDDQWNMAAIEIPTPTPTPTPTFPGEMSFHDEFNKSTLNTGKWVSLDRTGDASNSEQQCYSPSHVSVGGGLLTLSTDASTCPDGKPYTSGAIQMRSFSFTYGTVEFRSRESGGQGTWPAEWLLGSNCQQTNVASAGNDAPCSWPNPGSDEIDIAEVMGHDLTTVHQGIHSGGNNAGCAAETTDVSQNWHTHQLVWSPGSLVWKIDGAVTCTQSVGVPSTPMFLIINTAVGGIGGGTVDPSTLPQTHQVDYVRVYPSGVTPTPTPAPTPTPGTLAVHVSGNHLVNGVGSTIQLHGVNRSGTEYACVQGFGPFDGPSDDASVAAIASWHGVNAVRVPLNEDCWLGINGFPNGGYSAAQYQAAIAAYLGKLHAHGLYAILELHWAAPGTSAATWQNQMPDNDHSPAFWSQVATAYQNDPATVFDLFNEPVGVAYPCWRDGCTFTGDQVANNGRGLWQVAGMQQLVTTVRDAGASNVIILGGLSFANDMTGWLTYKPTDPANQLAASFHTYNFNSCHEATCWDAQVAPVAAQVPLVTGEVGESDGTATFMNAYTAWADPKGISYLAWTWDTWGCSNGAVLISDYAGTPCPGYGAGYRAHLAAG